MTNTDLIGALSLFTLLLAIGVFVWQFVKVRKARQRHAQTHVGDLRMPQSQVDDPAAAREPARQSAGR